VDDADDLGSAGNWAVQDQVSADDPGPRLWRELGTGGAKQRVLAQEHARFLDPPDQPQRRRRVAL
jgi:hypothetical protein